MKPILFLLVLVTCLCVPASAQLPSGWLSTDIGAVGGTGTASESSGTFTLSDRGTQIYDRADSGRFAYRHAEANGQIVARVATMAATDNYAQAGVMIRETLLPGAKSIGLFVTKTKGLQLLVRNERNGDTAVISVTGFAAPQYLRLTRTGLDFVAEYSANGSTWTQVSTTRRITMLTWCIVGLATSAHDAATLRAATFDNVAVTFPTVGATYHYVAPTAVTGSGAGTWANPWSLRDAVITNVGSIAPGSRIFLRGGTYYGKFTSPLAGNSGNRTVMREYPGERAILDGNWTTTLTSSIGTATCSTTPIQLGNAEWVLANASPGTTIRIDNEVINANAAATGTTLNTCVRGWAGTAAASHSAGATVFLTGHITTWTGGFLDLWDFEIQNSRDSRQGTGEPYPGAGNESSNWPTERGASIVLQASDIRLRHLVWHDTGDGMNGYAPANNLDAYGIVSYNVGVWGTARGNGNGWYFHGQPTGSRTLAVSTAGNMMAVPCRSSSNDGFINNVVMDQMICWHGGILWGRGNNATGPTNALAALELLSEGSAMVNVSLTNSIGFNRLTSGAPVALLGGGAANSKNVSFANNRLIGGVKGLSAQNIRTGTITTNFIYSTNGDDTSDAAIQSHQSTTQGGYSGTVDTNGTTVTYKTGTPFNWSWGTGCTGCPSTITINGTNYTIASVPDAQNTMTLTTSAGTQTGVAYAVSANTESHPLVASITWDSNTIYNNIGGNDGGTTPGSSTRQTYPFNYKEPGVIVTNGLGGGPLKWTPDSGKAWNDWNHSDTASAYNTGKPTGTVVRFNPAPAFESGRGHVAHVAVENWDDANTITISAANLNTVLAAGDKYEIWKAENYGGAPLVSTTHNGAAITVPMTDRSVLPAIGLGYVPTSSLPRFGALLIVRK